MLLLANVARADDVDLCKGARSMWCDLYGAPRSSPTKPRIDIGKPRRPNPLNESFFLQQRHASVSVGAQSLDVEACTEPAPRVVGQDGWEDLRTVLLPR